MKLKLYVGTVEGFTRSVMVDSLRGTHRYVRIRGTPTYQKFSHTKSIEYKIFEYFDEIEEEDLEITLTAIALLGGT